MATALATSLISRLSDLIARYGTTVELVQGGTSAIVAGVPAIIQLAAAGDHTPFFTSTILDTFVRPFFTVLFSGAVPQFGGTEQITTDDFVSMTPPGGSAAVQYYVRAVSYECVEAGTAISTKILVSL